jgi:DNA-binding transcriptional ArsR family regulator
MKNKPLVSVKEVRAASRVLRAVNHQLRRDILSLLDRKKEMTVSQIWGALKIEQSVCSSHLGILRREGIVGVRQVHKSRYYYLDRARLQEINLFCRDISL